jgi:tripartite-type tricarboxylate transporter receptor subunit TctC
MIDRAVRAAVVLSFVSTACFAAPAVAQDYPSKPIRAICNFAPGSGADILVRYYSDKLAKLAGQPVIVENKVGAQGNIATEFVARSRGDGYTILITPASSTLAAAPHIFKQLSYEPLKDLVPVTTLAKLSFVIAVDAAKPIHSIAALTDSLRKKPDHGLYGAGTNSGQVAAELFKEATGLKTTYVPYKTSVQALNDLVGGQIDFMVYDATFMVTHARSGRVRILAVTSATRASALPHVPTMAELGFAGYDITPWWGVVVPAGTPKPIVGKLAGWFNQIAVSEETKQFLERVATDVFPGTPESMAALLKSDTEQWRRFVRLARIEPQ